MYAEIERQTDILEAGGTVVQETMRYDEGTDSVSPMREKENSDDTLLPGPRPDSASDFSGENR
jgi:Asp-tRNA(Asn)/Glu-tRNA(Gln) amidotransferase B subunit